MRVVLPEYREYDHKTKKTTVKRDFPVVLESAPICCLSDIPSPHLRYHAYRYGKFAIGFHRDAAIRAGFNPVLYTLDSTSLIRTVYEGLSSLDNASAYWIDDAASDLEYKAEDMKRTHDDVARDFLGDIQTIRSELEYIEETLSDAKESIMRIVAYTKTFDPTEFATVYCEREWRSIRQFRFSIDDIAMIVLPRRIGSAHYFRSFVERRVRELRLPRRIPVIAWDDLVEH